MTKIIRTPSITLDKVSISPGGAYSFPGSTDSDGGSNATETGKGESLSEIRKNETYSAEEYQLVFDELEQAKRANSQLKETLQEIEEGKADIYESAREAGHKNGYSEGKTSAGQETSDLNERLGSLIKNISEEKASFLSELEDEVVELVFITVSKIVGEAATDVEGIHNIVQEQIQKFRDQNEFLLLVAPDDLHVITSLADTNPEFENIKILPDKMIDCGGCIIKSDAGSLDARLDVQMDSFRESMLNMYEARVLNKA